TGSPTAAACAWRSSRRVPCMATRPFVSLIVLRRATTSIPAARKEWRAQAESLPVDQDSSTLTGRSVGRPEALRRSIREVTPSRISTRVANQQSRRYPAVADDPVRVRHIGGEARALARPEADECSTRPELDNTGVDDPVLGDA